MSGDATPPWEVPSHWTVTTMGDACQVVGGSTPKAKEPKYWGGDIQWLGVSDLTGYTGKWIAGGARSLTQEGYDSCSTTLMQRGAVLFSSRAPIGYVAIAAGPICTSQGFKSFVPPEGVEPEFLYWYLRALTPFARGRASGTTFPELSTKAAQALPLVIPPLEEQRAIVAAIEGAFARIDVIESDLDAVERGHAHFVAAVLRDAFRGLLTSPQGANGAEGTEPSTSGAGLPETWRWATIGDVCDKAQYGWTTKAADGGAVRFLRTTDLANGPVNWETVPFCADSPADASKYLLKSGDMLISRAGSVGFGAVLADDPPEETVFASYLIRFRPDPAIVSPRLMRWFIQSPQYWKAVQAGAVGVAMKNINARKLGAIPVPVPPLCEQDAIASAIEDAIEKANSVICEVARARDVLAALRLSVLHRAFTGDLLRTSTSEIASVA